MVKYSNSADELLERALLELELFSLELLTEPELESFLPELLTVKLVSDESGEVPLSSPQAITKNKLAKATILAKFGMRTFFILTPFVENQRWSRLTLAQ